MIKFRMMITVVRKTDDGFVHISSTYVSYCECMAEALERAGRYAVYQVAEEHADYIKHISVTAVTEDGYEK